MTHQAGNPMRNITEITHKDGTKTWRVRFRLSPGRASNPVTETFPSLEAAVYFRDKASWALFRFLCGGQFSGSVLIMVCGEFLGGGVAEGFMETGIVPPVNPVHGGPFNLGA